MSDGLDVIILDDEPQVCEIMAEIIGRFYSWGDIFVFTKVDDAMLYGLNRETSIALFVIDVFLGDRSGFYFIDGLASKYKSIYDDTIIVTGHASDEVVDMCIAADIKHLLEKPVRPYVLQQAVRAIASKYVKYAGRIYNDINVFQQESFMPPRELRSP